MITFRRDTDRGSYSWDEGVLDKAVKDMLVERAEDTIRHFWNETGGEKRVAYTTHVAIQRTGMRNG